MAKQAKYQASEIRKSARKEFSKAGFTAHAGHLSEIMGLKRALYRLEGRALSRKERKAIQKQNSRKIVIARKALVSALKLRGYESLAEAKMAARALGCFDKQ